MKSDTTTLRRDLSGIYIFDKLPQDETRKPTCIEDCTIEKRTEWLKTLDRNGLKVTAKRLNSCMSRIWDMLEPEERNVFEFELGGKPFCETSLGLEPLINEINRFCGLIRTLAEIAGICAEGSEADLNRHCETVKNCYDSDY